MADTPGTGPDSPTGVDPQTTGMDRRSFLRVAAAAGGGLLVTVSLPGCVPEASSGTSDGAAEIHRLTAWVALDTDGVATVRIPVPEIGQGVRTSLAMLVAEELEVPWEDVRVEQARAADDLGPHPLAGGSNAVAAYWEPLRRAGAVARTALVGAAAARWTVSPGECTAEGGEVRGPDRRRASFGELAAEAVAAGSAVDPESVQLKPPSQFRLVGRPHRSLDQEAIATGRMEFGTDVSLPGMSYAVITRCPVYGGTVRSVDDAATLALPGVSRVVRVPSYGDPERPYQVEGVAVVGDSTWSALRGRDALRVEWDPGPNAHESSAELRRRARALLDERSPSWRESGDVEAALARATRRISADYSVPFIVHAPMEPPACTALVEDGRAVLWAPTQIPLPARATVARLLEMEPEAVTVHVIRSGGGFGRRLSIDHVLEAAHVARRIEGPVKVMWTREDDVRHGFFRPMSEHRLEAGLDAAGRVTGWLHRQTGTSRYAFRDGEPPARSAFRAGTWPIALVPDHRLEYGLVESKLPRGPLRAPGHNAFTFALESFLDEVARVAGRDPLEFRLELLGEPRAFPYEEERDFETGRMAGVLRAAADRADWGSAPPPGRGRGIAATYTFGSYAAQVAEASVDRESGRIRVHRMVCAIDCGRVVNPAGLRAQMQGGTLDGLGATLHQEITVEGGAVQESNFHDFPLLRLNEAPEVDTVIVDSALDPSGAGEPPYVPVQAAVANAVADAIGVRLRELPLTPARVRRAIEES